jgi:four helix bundle protein
MALKTYRELDAWKKAMDLVVSIYRLADELPTHEKFGLTRQMQRAAVSIPANIAEGYGRSHRGDYLHHLSIARGSLAELETHMTLVVRLGFLNRENMLETWDTAQDVGKMLKKLISSLEERPERRDAKPKTRNPKPETRNPEPAP